jgi:hypothetical protein
VLPNPETVINRRRALHEEEDSDLHLRCFDHVSVCYHTHSEIVHLHSGSPLPAGADHRMLETRSSTVSAALLKEDSYAVESDSGSVSWTAFVSGGDDDGAASTSGNANAASGDKIEYDEWGCIAEDGGLTHAFPLTSKHCYRAVETHSCDFTVDDNDENGFSTAMFSMTYKINNIDESFVKEPFYGCNRDLALASFSGFCECGAGYKIKTGTCKWLMLSRDIAFHSSLCVC